VLTWATYAAIGGLRGAIATHAEAVLARLPPPVAGAFAEVVPQLVTIDPASGAVAARVAAWEEIVRPGTAGAGERAALLDALVGPEGRLLVSDAGPGGPGGAVLRLAHEALVAPGNWPRIGEVIERHRGFLRDRARVEAYAAVWEAENRAEDRLLVGERPLAEARDLLAHPIPRALRAFIEQSLAAQARRAKALAEEAQRRTARLLRLAVAAALVFAVLGGLATWQWREAEVAKEAAEGHRREAVASERLAHEARAAEEAVRKSLEEAIVSTAEARGAQGSATSAMQIAQSVLPGRVDPGTRAYASPALSVLAQALNDNRERLSVIPDGEGFELVDATPDGRHVLAYGRSGRAQLWDAEAGFVLEMFSGVDRPVDGQLFFPDGSRFLVVRGDGEVRVHALAHPGVAQVSFDGHQGRRGRVGGLAISGDGAWVASAQFESLNQTQVAIWNAATGEMRRRVATDMGLVTRIRLNHDGSRLLVQGPQEQLRLLDVSSGGWIGELPEAIAPAAYAFSPDGRQLAVGVGTGAVVILDAADGGIVAHKEMHGGAVTAVAFMPDGQRLVTGSADRSVRLWSADLESALGAYHGHQNPVTFIAVASNSETVASVDRDAAHVWWPDSPGQARRFGAAPGHVKQVALSPRGERLFLADHRRSFRVFDLSEPVPALEIDTGRPLDLVARSSDGRVLATASEDGVVELWQVPGGTRLFSGQAHERSLTGLAFSGDGRSLLTASEDGTVALWRVADGGMVWRSARHAGQAFATFMPDGAVLTRTREDRAWSHATPGWRAPVRILDGATGAPRAAFEGHGSWVTAAVPVAGGRQVLSAESDGPVILWDAATGHEIRRFGLRRGDGGAYGFHNLLPLSDGRRVVAWASSAMAVLDMEAGGFGPPGAIRDGRANPAMYKATLHERAGLVLSHTLDMVWAWRIADGSLAWSYRRGDDDQAFSGPVVVDGTGDLVAIGTQLGGVWLMDAGTGTRWRAWRPQQSAVKYISIDEDALLTAGADGYLVTDPTPMHGPDVLDVARTQVERHLAPYWPHIFREPSYDTAVGQGGLGAAALPSPHRCAALASPLGAAQGVAPVAFGDIDVAAGEAACGAAVVAMPGAGRLNMLLGRVLLKKGDLAEAAQRFAAAERGGDARGTAYLADRLLAGSGMARNQAEGLRLLLRAAEAGDAYAMLRLGELYRDGGEVAADASAAREWFARGAAAGYPYAMLELGRLLADPRLPTHDPALGLYWSARAAEAFGRLEGFWAVEQEAVQNRGNAARRLPPGVAAREFRRARTDAGTR
jgi:WD40 repeat protein